jgi:hypothetical protein
MRDDTHSETLRATVGGMLCRIVVERLSREALDDVYCVFLAFLGSDGSYFDLVPRLLPAEEGKLEYCRKAGLGLDAYRWDPFNPPRIEWKGEPQWEIVLDHQFDDAFVRSAQRLIDELDGLDEEADEVGDSAFSGAETFAAGVCRRLNEDATAREIATAPVFVAWTPVSHNDLLMRASLAPGQVEALAADGLIGASPAGGD